MKNISPELKEVLDSQHAVTATPRVIAEWNHNRFGGIKEVYDPSDSSDNRKGIDNSNAEEDNGFDPEVYPIESIADPLRPTRAGLYKGRAGEGYATSTESDKRTFTSSPEDKYKYWTSPYPSKTVLNTNFGPAEYAFYGSNQVWPHVLYAREVPANKIVIVVENSFNHPVRWSIDHITTDPTIPGAPLWQILVNEETVTFPANGRLELYRQPSGLWTDTPPATAEDRWASILPDLSGVRFRFETGSKINSHANVIEVSARLELDLSEDLIDYSTTLDLSEVSLVAPIGKISSNEGKVEFSNDNFRYDNDNEQSVLKNLIDKNVKMIGDLYYPKQGTMPDGEYVRLFTMYTDSWTGAGEPTSSAALKDASKFLQEITPNKMLFEDLTVAEIVWRLCDSIGFVDYQKDSLDLNMEDTIPYFWTDGESTVWQIFDELAEATQCAIYFDEYGILQVRGRPNTGEQDRVGILTYEEYDDGGKTILPNIIDLSESGDFEANHVNVQYRVAKPGDEAHMVPKMETVWEPEGTYTVRSSNLIHNTTATQQHMKINPEEASVWPYSGTIQVEGEIASYAAKQYNYYDDGVLKTTNLKSAADKKKIDQLDLNLNYKNAFTGNLVGMTRGIWGTHPRPHYVDVKNYTIRWSRIIDNVFTKYSTVGLKLAKNEGHAHMWISKGYDARNVKAAFRNSSNDAMPYQYGMRFRFRPGENQIGVAGLVLSAGSNDAGYYIEVAKSAHVAPHRAVQNEVTAIVKQKNGQITRFGKGAVTAIEEGRWYNLDVNLFNNDYDGTFSLVIFLNGVLMNHYRYSRSDVHAVKTGHGGRFGMFVRGQTSIDVEYLYAFLENPRREEPDHSTRWDMINGGFTTLPFVENVYQVRDWRISKNKTIRQKYNQILFDDFKSVVHEVRQENVTFEKPVLHSKPYISNEKVLCVEYTPNPFGADMVLVNASRENEVVHGEDRLTYGPDNPVDQKFLIYGREINQEDPKDYIVKNADAIRRRGRVELEIASDWIQTEEMAKSIGDWIVQHWGDGNDELKVEVFGNPSYQLLDVVGINWNQGAEPRFTPDTHEYYIVGIDNSYSDGLTTSLTLRRAK